MAQSERMIAMGKFISSVCSVLDTNSYRISNHNDFKEGQQNRVFLKHGHCQIGPPSYQLRVSKSLKSRRNVREEYSIPLYILSIL